MTGYAKNVHLEKENAQYYWNSPDDASMVSTDVGVSGNDFYLNIDASDHPDEGLKRLLVPANTLSEPVVDASTAVTGVGGYDGYYLQFKTTFPAFDAGTRPEIDGRDRLVFWSCGGALYVTAGRFAGSTRNVESRDYKIVASGVDADAWHTITLRVISDVQTGAGALGFQIWLDGNSVTADQAVTDGSLSPSVLTPEARVLIAQRRLFPALSVPGVNESVALGGAAFTGSGSVDDFVYSLEPPSAAMKAPNVFMLRWDAGVKTLSYKVNGGASVSVPSIGERNAVFEIPAGATVAVTAGYDTGCSKGVWRAESACSLSDTAFTASASSALSVGYVGSFYPSVTIGDGAFSSFADAKEAAKESGETISLDKDFFVAADSRDEGRIYIAPGETVTIDLKGHTLGTTCSEYPTIWNRGTLTIIDTVGGGKVKALADEFTGDAFDMTQVAVMNQSEYYNVPSLTIGGGVYEGLVISSGVVVGKDPVLYREAGLKIVRNGGTGEPKFRSLDGEEFAFAEKVEDPKLFYVYEEPYWQPSEIEAFIWCGKGNDNEWSTAANWRCNSVPGVSDVVYFPSKGTNAWEVTVADSDAIGKVMLAGNVNLHGTADFTAADWQDSVGRVSGDAVLVWNGKLPPDLMATLFAEAWAGTVAIVDVGDASPKLMTDMAGWGTASSTVRFNGVRGYYHKTENLMVPWTLELVDGSNGYAWKNDAGFTGGVITFPVLVGNGRFVSPKNTIANRQVIVFRDAYAYGGVLEVYGKRVVIGPGEVCTQEAGSITWSDGAQVKNKSVPDECRVAAFGGALEFFGNWGSVLAKYSDFTVDDSAVVVTLAPGDLAAELCVDQPVGEVRIVRWSENAVIIDGRRVVITDEDPVGELNSLSAFSAPDAESPVLKRLSSAAAGYYTPTLETKGELTTLTFALNERAVPVMGRSGEESAKMRIEDGLVSIVVSGVIKGFWYGLEYKASLTEGWNRPEIWEVAGEDGGQIELVAPAEGAAGFYRVVVSDVKPEEGDAE